jgi:type I restriction enzyme S subunit
VPKRGDVLIAKDGSVMKHVFVVEEETKSAVLSSIAILRPDPKKVDSNFLSYALQEPSLKAEILSNYVSGSGVPRIILRDFKNIKIPTPDIRIQRKVSEILKTLEEKILVNNTVSSTLELIAQTFFRSWFMDFDPVRAKVAGEPAAEIDYATTKLFPDSFQDSELGLIPYGWRVTSLGSTLTTIESGKRPRGGSQLSGIPSVGAESVRRIGEFNFSATKYIPEEFFLAMPTGKVKPYDVLIYKDGAGAGSFVSMFGEGFPFDNFAINEHVFLLRSNQLPQIYLFHWLNQKSQKSLMVELAQKSAQPGLNQADTKSMPILVPSEEVLQAFIHVVEPLIRTILSNSKQNQTLQELRDFLLPRLISGELQIPDEMLES